MTRRKLLRSTLGSRLKQPWSWMLTSLSEAPGAVALSCSYIWTVLKPDVLLRGGQIAMCEGAECAPCLGSGTLIVWTTASGPKIDSRFVVVGTAPVPCFGKAGTESGRSRAVYSQSAYFSSLT